MPRLRELDIVSPTLVTRFAEEGRFDGADGRHYGLILRDNFDLLSHHPSSPSLNPMQIIWAGAMLRLLNTEVNHSGAWVVVFTHVLPPDVNSSIFDNHADYGRYCLIWLDHDGDPQFTVEWEKGVTTDLATWKQVAAQGYEAVAQKCEMAWQTWNVHMRDVLEVVEGTHTFKRAKGELPPSAH